MTMTETEPTTHILAEVGAKNLRDALRAGLVSASKDRMLPILCALRISAKADGSIVVESTDRFRLTEATCPKHRGEPDTHGAEWAIMIDRVDVERLVKMLPSVAKPIDYAHLRYIPRPTEYGQAGLSVQVNYESSITMAEVIGDFPRVSALWPDLDAPHDGLTSIGFNPQHLTDIGKLPWPKGNPTGVFHFTSPTKPAVIAHEDDNRGVSFRHLIMPRRLTS